jgi:hypothetical protein
MQDFTLATYKKLLQELLASGYSFQALKYFIQRPEEKTAILRHDVDRLPENALVIARIEKEADVSASYYFRIVKESYDEDIIKQISEMGHEIGYHYEDLSIYRGNNELAIKKFESNLEKFRKYYPVKTICMHGSPLSKYDNKKIWEKYDYKNFGIIAEPYFDVNFDEVFYITDTGRSWNNSKASVRDKVIKTEARGRRAEVKGRERQQFDIKIKDTNDLIEKIQNSELPEKIMINVHPQRWNDKFVPWVSELVMQNVKNVVKRMIARRKKDRR